MTDRPALPSRPGSWRVVVTRPQPQADEWVERLLALGQPAVALPLMRIEADPAFDGAVTQAWHELSRCRLVMFVSPNAVAAFFARRPAQAAWPPDVLAGATGPGTVAALEAAGVPAAAIVAPARDGVRFDAEAVWSQALSARDWSGAFVLIVRGETGREWLAQTLRSAGATVQTLAAYRRSPPAWEAPQASCLHAVLADATRHIWLFSSSQAIEYLADHLRALGRLSEAVAMPVLATHPRIAETARRLGFACVDEVPPYPGAVVAGVQRHATLVAAASIESSTAAMTDDAGSPSSATNASPAAAGVAAPAPVAAAAASAGPSTGAGSNVTPVPMGGVEPGLPRFLLRWWAPLATLLCALLLVSLVMAWQAQSGLHGLERELVRRQQASGQQAAEALLLAKQAQELVRDTAAKVALVDTRLSEVALQRTQLEELLQSLSRSRDENLITDIDAAIRVALQQSAITGSAEPLVAALRSADERLARVSQPRLERVRRAIAHDLDRVRAVGVPEIGSLMIKLDEAVRLVDEAPLLSNPRARQLDEPVPTAPASRQPAAGSTAAGTSGGDLSAWFGRYRHQWDGFWASAGAQARQLLRVTRIEQPEAMLVAPEQALFLRENIKLRILNARLALLSRQPEAAQGDLQLAISAVQRYFDGGARRTQAVLELLRQCAQQSHQVSIPRPDETLAAVTAAAAGR